MVHSSEGVPDADKHKSSLVASDAAGSLYAAEQAKLKATAQEIFGYSDAFKYSSFDRYDDKLSRNFDQTFTRIGGGVDLVAGSFGAATLTIAGAGSAASAGWNPYAVPGAALAGGLAISSYAHAASGAESLLGSYESGVGSRVLRSFEEGSGSSYTGRLAVSAATDAAIIGLGYGVGKALPAMEAGVVKVVNGSRSAAGASVSSTAAEGSAVTKEITALKPATFDYTAEGAQYSLRIDPITGKGPMHVDSREFTSATSYTAEGAARNKNQFWKLWAEKYPETVSESNLERIKSSTPVAPRVDEVWLKHFPEHQNYINEILVHHHLDHGHPVTGLPDKLHKTEPGRSMFHTNLGGKKK